MERYEMCINEVEIQGHVHFISKTTESSIYGQGYLWESLFTGSSFSTDTAYLEDVDAYRWESDQKFQISQIEACLDENRYKLTPERIEGLRKKLQALKIENECLNRSNMFCDSCVPCSLCKNVEYSLDEEELALA
jgi:hypothetical protein